MRVLGTASGFGGVKVRFSEMIQNRYHREKGLSPFKEGNFNSNLKGITMLQFVGGFISG